MAHIAAAQIAWERGAFEKAEKRLKEIPPRDIIKKALKSIKNGEIIDWEKLRKSIFEN